MNFTVLPRKFTPRSRAKTDCNSNRPFIELLPRLSFTGMHDKLSLFSSRYFGGNGCQADKSKRPFLRPGSYAAFLPCRMRFKEKIMKQIISLSIVSIAFDTAEMRRMNRLMRLGILALSPLASGIKIVKAKLLQIKNGFIFPAMP